VSKEFSPQELLKELVARFKIKGINIVGSKLEITAECRVAEDVKKYLLSRGFELLEEKPVDLTELYTRLVGGM